MAPESQQMIDGGDDDDGDSVLIGALGDSKWWPPGFRFHPTDEELVLYYLKRKVCRRRIRLPMIGDVDVYKFEPWELPERSVLRSGDKQWFFFSPRDRKYPNGARSNRTTRCGYWKATGKDRTISQGSRAVGNKKTLVYYQGRAPKGQRTDWVMHEYALEEQVLLNFNNVQDSYALYKLFRKSGPGPKNGEQYGAPFKEEEWNEKDGVQGDTTFRDLDNRVEDDEQEDTTFRDLDNRVEDGEQEDTTFRDLDNRVEEVSENIQDDSVTTMLGDGANALLEYNLEKFLLQMPDEQVVLERQVDAGVDAGTCVIGTSYFDAVSYQKSGGWCEQDSVDMNFQLLQTASTFVQPIEICEVASITNISEQALFGNDEEFLEIKDLNDPDCPSWGMNDMSQNPIEMPEVTSITNCSEQVLLENDEEFLEIKDLNDPNCPAWDMDDVSQKDHTQDVGEFYDPCDYFDADMFLAEAMGPLDGIAPPTYFDGFAGYEDAQNQASNITSELWTYDQSLHVSTVVGSNQTFMVPPASGAVCENTPSNVGVNSVGQINYTGSESDSWFNSAISSLLDSIPSRPAIASENALITRALERVSSFKGGQIGNRAPNSTAGGAALGGRQVGQNGGFLFVSFLVGICAVFWFLAIGVTVKVVKGIWGRFVTS